MIGRWQLGDLLGSGGFSKVFAAEHADTGAKAALKIMTRAALGQAAEKQLSRELEAMRTINSPHVVKMFEADPDAAYPHRSGRAVPVLLVALELCSGGELFDFLSYTGLFEESVARSYFHQLIAGLKACHDQHIAHRDLKPDNLLLSSDFVLKIADFGLSTTVVDGQVLRTQCGTLSYLAPEVLARGGYDGFMSDIWAAGVILFIMLAGFPPFVQPHPTDWYFKQLAVGQHARFWEAHLRVAFFSHAAKDLINKLLCTDPLKRITLGGVLEHPWFNGPVLPAAQLSAEMARRKAEIDVRKAQVEAERRAAGHQAAASMQDEIDRTFRTVRASDDASAAETAPDASHAVPCYTQFTIGLAPARARESVLQALLRYQLQHHTGTDDLELADDDGAGERPLSLSVELLVPSELGGGILQLAVLVYSAEDGRASLVQFRRLSGSAFAFRSVYEDAAQEVSGVEALHPIKRPDYAYCGHPGEEFVEAGAVDGEVPMRGSLY